MTALLCVMNSDVIITVMIVAYFKHFSPHIPENGMTDVMGEGERGGSSERSI